MEPSIYRYILRNTRRDQIILILFTVASFPFVYWSLDVPKTIINKAIGSEGIPAEILGIPMTQIGFLFVMCLLFILLVIINGLFKYFLNVYRGILGERMLHRLRFELYSRLLRFPLPHFKRTSSSELIPVITSETEPLGGFIGDAFALPVFQGGLLLTYSYFIFMQDFFLGLAAIALYPPQLWLIPRLQRKVNALARKRVQTVRELADNVGESVAGITEIHSNATAVHERSKMRSLLDRIFIIRSEIYRRKFFIKFLNNFLAQLTPFMFYLIGGYFVIKGELSLGALVAVIAAYKDLASPWKELLKYYQTKEDARIKYAQIIEQFQLPVMLSSDIQDSTDGVSPSSLGEVLVVRNLEHAEDELVRNIEHASFSLSLDEHTAIVGAGGSGKEYLAPLLARLVHPSKGQIMIGTTNMADLTESALGQWLAYIGPTPHAFTGTIEDNLFYGLHQRVDAGHQSEQQEVDKSVWANLFGSSSSTDNTIPNIPNNARKAGHFSSLHTHSVTDSRLQRLALEMADVANFRSDAFRFGLNAALSPQYSLEHSEILLRARHELQQRLKDPEFIELVEPLDRDRYNLNLSLAENFLFGTPMHEDWHPNALSQNAVICRILDEQGLTEDFLEIGLRLTQIMLEMFADVSPESELFQRFSFISAEDLPEFSALLQRSGDDGVAVLDSDDRERLLSLPFMLTVGRHRLGLVDAGIQAKIVEARRRLAAELGEQNEFVQFYNPAHYSPAMSVQDNILFGKVAYGLAHAEDRVAELLGSTLDDLELRDDIESLGFRHHVGTGGARLTAIQRQKMLIVRALLKQPELLILDQTTTVFDPIEERRMITALRRKQLGKGLICVLDRPELAENFDRLLVMERGRVVEQGKFHQLVERSDSALSRLLAGT